jgi:uncharacterized integral membrane protein
MSVPPQPVQTTKARKGIKLQTVLLLGAAVALTLFCAFNRESTLVRPFGSLPLYAVILLSFVLGALIGWLAKSILGSRRSLAPDEVIMERNQRY